MCLSTVTWRPSEAKPSRRVCGEREEVARSQDPALPDPGARRRQLRRRRTAQRDDRGLGRHRLLQAALRLVSLRAATATHGNIVARKAFTISLPSGEQAAAGRLLRSGLGTRRRQVRRDRTDAGEAEFVDAPYVAEFPLVVECEVVRCTSSACTPSSSARSRTSRSTRLPRRGRPHRRGQARPARLRARDRRYFALGALIGPAFSIGKTFVRCGGDAVERPAEPEDRRRDPRLQQRLIQASQVWLSRPSPECPARSLSRRHGADADSAHERGTGDAQAEAPA
jgi:hypothetical protein